MNDGKNYVFLWKYPPENQAMKLYGLTKFEFSPSRPLCDLNLLFIATVPVKYVNEKYENKFHQYYTFLWSSIRKRRAIMKNRTLFLA